MYVGLLCACFSSGALGFEGSEWPCNISRSSEEGVSGIMFVVVYFVKHVEEGSVSAQEKKSNAVIINHGFYE